MKTKSLLATLLVTIILLSSCVLGVAENESASVSFKINKTSIAEQRTSISRQDTDGGSNEENDFNEESYIIVSIIDAATEEVIASQELSGEAKSAAFEIQIGLTIIGKIEVYYGYGDNIPHPEITYISAPYTVTAGQNNIEVYDDGDGNGAEIYLNPLSGADGTGTKDFPVSTIKHAVDLLPDGGTIWVMNSINITTTESWDYNNITLKRYSADGFLINVNENGNLTLENITIDGNNVETNKPLISVDYKSSLTLNNGAILRNNNNILVTGGTGGTGGGVENNGTLNIKGGTITGNTALEGGGGVINYGTLNITGGTITGNTVIAGAGGGVVNSSSSTLTFNTGGIINISENTSGNSLSNISYNADAAPRVSGSIEVATGTTIGLSPSNADPGAILVLATNPSDIDARHFSLDAGGNIELSDDQGLVVAAAGEFTYTPTGGEPQTYRISNELTTGGSTNNGRYTWEEARDKWGDGKINDNNGWYLPSKEELDAAYDELYADGKPLYDDKLTTYLWSSTEGVNNEDAWKQRFSDGTQVGTDSKTESLGVRLIIVN